MTPLEQLLEQRLTAARSQTQVVCGALGTLAVEGLSPREFTLLSRGEDSPRRVLYAACRQLQLAGEALHNRGLVFRPEQIMDYVTEQEAQMAYNAIAGMSIGGSTVPEQTEQSDSPLPSAGIDEDLSDTARLPLFRDQTSLFPEDEFSVTPPVVPDIDFPPAPLSSGLSLRENTPDPVSLPSRPLFATDITGSAGRQEDSWDVARELLEGLQRAAAAAG